jgi:predicted DNA-binding transcriptional regulator AlpA
MTDDLASKIDELIATIRATSSGDLYLDAAGVAAVLSFSYKHTRDKIVHLPDFPAPLRMGDGHARWLRSDVIKWGKMRSAKRKAA